MVSDGFDYLKNSSRRGANDPKIRLEPVTKQMQHPPRMLRYPLNLDSFD